MNISINRILEQVRRLFPYGREDSGIGSFTILFHRFQEILAINNQVLEEIAEANNALGGDYIFDRNYINTFCQNISQGILNLINNLDAIAPRKYTPLHDAYRRIMLDIDKNLTGRKSSESQKLVLSYEVIERDNVENVGGKNANISELQNFLNIKIPAGFAITNAAFEAFLGKNNLRKKINSILTSWKSDTLALESAAEKIQQLILDSPLPNQLDKELAKSIAQLRTQDDQSLFLAVRSSARGEDGEQSFAGQYESFLNVTPDKVIEAYHKVIASAYSANTLAYRRKIGFDEEQVSMAVACQTMIDAEAAGVLYTLDPGDDKGTNMLISSSWGLGSPIVSGSLTGDRFTVERKAPYKIKGMQIVRKDRALMPTIEGGTSWRSVTEDKQTLASLTNSQIKQLAKTGLAIEKYFKKPQDIEFAFDRQGELIILQSRTLHLKQARVPKIEELSKVLDKYPVLFRDQGDIAQKGIGSGKVFFLSNETKFSDVPPGSVIVTKYASPQMAKVMPKISAFLTDIGSTTGHLATIAREFRVPCIMNIGNVTTLLQSGQEVTVDADVNIVYKGLVNELCYYDLTEDAIEESPEYNLLRKVLKKIAPLNLIDPSEKNFTPEYCQTMHDIIRFVHEKAVDELIDQSIYHHPDQQSAAGKLCWDIPLDLVLIDIGDGLRPDVVKGKVTPEEINSTPMRALLDGLAHPNAWNNEPTSIDLEGFMASLTRTFSPELAEPQYVGKNLAVISKDYANVSLRLGYHFTMIDSYVTDNINSNYAYFRFFGGVTEHVRRSRRVQLLGKILAEQDFRIEVHGDLLVARLKKLDKAGMLRRLYLLGLLVGFARQLDVKMLSDEHIDDYISKFKKLMEMEI